MKRIILLLFAVLVLACAPQGGEGPATAENAATAAAEQKDNALTPEEEEAGWILLFDGESLDEWMNDSGDPSRRPIEEGSINPHKSGGYMVVHKKMWENYILALDFKISPGCNSGIFVKTFSLEARPNSSVAFNGIEVAIDDTTTAGYHDTGAIYDLVKPTRNAMKAAGEWNHAEITVNRNIISVNLNGEDVTRIDLAEFTEPHQRPDGTRHKFDVGYKDHPPKGYIGLQDHGADLWFKNIKLKPLD